MRKAGLAGRSTSFFPGIKTVGRNIKDLRYADDTTLMVRKRRTKEPLDESERGE